jgi:hypothetical protein
MIMQTETNYSRLGGHAKIAYYTEGSTCQISGNIMSCTNPPKNVINNYAKYSPIALEKTKITSSTLVIFPEVETQFLVSCSLINIDSYLVALC